MTAKLVALGVSIGVMKVFVLLYCTQLVWRTTESVTVTSTTAQAQVLSAQEIGFPCGSDYCQRKGFVFCVRPPLVEDMSDAYCLSCELKKNTCGTSNEVVGCNLYCQELLLNESATKCEETIKDLRKELSLNQMNPNATEYEETIKDLRKALQNMTLRALTVMIFMSVVIVTMLTYIILSKKSAYKGTTTSDFPSLSEEGHNKENSDSLHRALYSSKESGIEEDVHMPLMNYEATKNDLTKNERVCSCKAGTSCYGEHKLKNVQPVENGRVEIAVGNSKEHTIVQMKVDTKESGEFKSM